MPVGILYPYTLTVSLHLRNAYFKPKEQVENNWPQGSTVNCRDLQCWCPHWQELVIAGVYFRQMSEIYFSLGCPYYKGVHSACKESHVR